MAKKRHKKRALPGITKLALGITLILFLILLGKTVLGNPSILVFHRTKTIQMPEIQEELLTPNQYSRSQKKLTKVNGIVIHYVANPALPRFPTATILIALQVLMQLTQAATL